MGALLGDATLLLVGLSLFFQSGMEITLGGWSAQYVREVLGLSEERSILVLSLFWVGMVAARLVLTRLLRFRPAATVFPAFLAVAWRERGCCWPCRASRRPGRGSSCWGSVLRRDSRSC